MDLQTDLLLHGACGRDEEGEYFAVDIGGTNYRVIYVQLSSRKGEVVRTTPHQRPLLLSRHHYCTS